MDGAMRPGWYDHPNLGLIKIFQKNGSWVYICYLSDGSKAISRPKTMDPWTWALSQENTEHLYVEEE